MEIINTISRMRECVMSLREKDKKIGFVPTMGALHIGHLELVNRSLAENDFVVASIFVNPIQFNNPSDLEKYPRNFERDVELLESLGCNYVFYPSADEMYPAPVSKIYDFGLLDKVMEGKFRPGHFNGVAIVVKKLFDIITPHKAYFGEKDYQQLAIIKALVKMEKIPVEIVPCPIVREADGLAMSSRNLRLSPDLRARAPLIYHTLLKARKMYLDNPVEEIRDWVMRQFASEPGVEMEYFEIANPETLEPVSEPKPTGSVIACIAVCFGDVRLIDNMVFNL